MKKAFFNCTGIQSMIICVHAHQHPLQTAQTVALSPAILQFLEADSVAQAYELLTNIYSLASTVFFTRHVQGDRGRGKTGEHIDK